MTTETEQFVQIWKNDRIVEQKFDTFDDVYEFARKDGATGRWVSDQKDDRVTYTFANGDVYEGRMVKNG